MMVETPNCQIITKVIVKKINKFVEPNQDLRIIPKVLKLTLSYSIAQKLRELLLNLINWYQTSNVHSFKPIILI